MFFFKNDVLAMISLSKYSSVQNSVYAVFKAFLFSLKSTNIFLRFCRLTARIGWQMSWCFPLPVVICFRAYIACQIAQERQKFFQLQLDQSHFRSSLIHYFAVYIFTNSFLKHRFCNSIVTVPIFMLPNSLAVHCCVIILDCTVFS